MTILDDLEALARAAGWPPNYEQTRWNEHYDWHNPPAVLPPDIAHHIAACSPERILALVAVARAAGAVWRTVMWDGGEVWPGGPHRGSSAGVIYEVALPLREALDALEATP